ncbi:MAG: gliding motility-associated C-terminal domain-containing protein, partial [Bacteroidales bacterium]|nr:gliding motility-associated C-terminal domain-containing protein [Bacteroidales bacterium]
YYLTQTVHGCESEKGTALVQILACPFAKPVIANVNACENDATVQDFEAQLPTTTTVPAQSWIWYDAEKNELPSNNTNTFASNVSTAVNGTTQTTTFYVGYTATEPTTQETCPSPLTEVTVTVFALPVIEINDPAKSLCYADGDVQITARVNGAAASNGEWTVKNDEAEISAYGIFNTKQKGTVDGSYTVVYTYTDPTTNCTNSDELIVNVEYPEVPSADDKNLLKSEDDIVLNAQGIESAENHIGTPNWYVLGVVDSDHSVDWKTPDDPTKVHSSQYYLSQTVNGCESEKYPVSVAVSSCPFKAPVAEQVNACQNAATVDDIVATSPASTTVDATSWIWYDSDMNQLTGSTNNYSSEVSTAEAGSTKFYVSYTAIDPNTSLECESAPAEVYVVVRPLPELTFSASNKTLACYDGGDVAWTATVDFHTNGAGSGSWTLDGKENNGITQRGVINPAFFGEETGTHRVTYTYTDGAGCVDSVAEDITIQFTPAPVVTDFAALTEQNKTVVVTATPSSNEAEISWYNANNVKKSNNADFETPDNGSVVTHKSYFATQTINSCESVKSEAKVDIIDCPVPKPVIVSPEAICNYDEVPELQATLGVWTSGSRPEGDAEVSFKYYESETGGEPISVTATGVYVPTIDATTAATYVYWVSEYNENVFPAACESKRTKVTLQVKKTEPPTIQASKTAVCYGNDNPSFSAIGQGIVRWHEEEPAYPAESYLSQGNPFVPSFDEVGVHTVWATQMVDGCESEAVSKDFEIFAIPEPPVVESATICEDGVNDTLKATPVENATIAWYANAEKTSVVSKNANFVPQNQFAGEYKYFATQTVKGCMSDTVSATYTILPLPTIPVVQTEATACDYDGTHELSVAEQDGISVAWYATPDTTSLLAVGNTFIHEITKSGTIKYYVRQIENGCVGNYVMAHFNVIPQPQKPNATGDVICEGFEASIYTDGAKDRWYSDEELTDMVGQGYTLMLPEVTQTHTYYVVRENNGCVSETAEAVVEVIPQPSVVIMQDGEEISQIRRCSYDADAAITASVSPKPTADDYMEWFIFPGNIKVKDTDSLLLSEYVNLSSSVTSSNSYTIRAQYSVKNTYKNMYCVSTMDTVKYTTFAKVRQPIVLSKVICQGEEIEPMFAFGTPNVTWISLDGINPPVFQGPKYVFSSQQTSLDTGSYRFQVYDINEETGCYSDTVEVSLTLAPGAETNLFGKDSVCVNTTDSYYTKYNSTSTYNWRLTGNHLNYSKDASSTSVRYVDWVAPGIDTLIVYEQTWAGCEGWDTLVIKVAPYPEPHFTWSMPGSANVIELQDSTIQDSLVSVVDGVEVKENIPYTMYWNYGHFDGDPNAIDKEVPYEQRNFPIREGSYLYGYNCPSLKVVNAFGCSNTTSECVFVNIASSLYIPSAFSPTNPAHSVRNFQPKGFNIEECKVSVYDKWGNLLWYSDEVKDGMFIGSWDGTYNGKMMKSDTYIWKIEAKFLDGQVWDGYDSGNGKKVKYGNVMLIR